MMVTQTFPPGSLIRHYRLQDLIGAGGMGVVYRAEDTRLGRLVALKFLREPDRAAEHRRRLLTEARAASALRSANIAAIYDIDEHEGAIFIVMEFVEGELLSQRLQRGRLSVDEAIGIAQQVADALDEAQTRGIVHRDIKSANLIITDRGLVKILDFGLAKFAAAEAATVEALTREVTAAGTLLGTVAYMSPEQALGRRLDARSDIFSLGVVLYEMLTGRRPFEGATPAETIDAILHREPPPIGRFVQVPPSVERIVSKALAKNLTFRYQTAGALYADLAAVDRVRTPMTPRPAATGSDALRGSDTGAARSGASARPSEQAVAVMTFTNITQEAGDDWIGTGIAETVTTDLKSIQGLTVISRAQIHEAVRNVAAGERSAADDRVALDIGRLLGASWVVGGGYQRLGDQIRITAQFLDVRTGTALNTVKIDGPLTGIFNLQDKIVYELTRGLNLPLGRAQILDIERTETRSVEAYEYYSRGMMNLRQTGRDSLDRAIYLFEKATERDPGYAAAWGALGSAYELKGSFLSLPELVSRGIDYLKRAIAIDPQSAETYATLGSACTDIGRYDEAESALLEAKRLDPKSARVRGNLGRVYWIGQGRLEAGIEELEQAVALNPQSGYGYLQLALLYAILGRFADATTAAERAVDLQEKRTSGKEGMVIVGARGRLGYVLYRQEQYGDAIREYERELAALEASDHALRERSMIEIWQKLGAAHLRGGSRPDGERYLAQAISAHESRVSRGADDPFTKYYAACAYALSGDRDRALRLLEESSQHLPALNAARRSRSRLGGLARRSALRPAHQRAGHTLIAVGSFQLSASSYQLSAFSPRGPAASSRGHDDRRGDRAVDRRDLQRT